MRLFHSRIAPTGTDWGKKPNKTRQTKSWLFGLNSYRKAFKKVWKYKWFHKPSRARHLNIIYIPQQQDERSLGFQGSIWKKEVDSFNAQNDALLRFDVLSTQLRLNFTTNSFEFQHGSTHSAYFQFLKSWLTCKLIQIRSFMLAKLTDLNLSIKL